MSLSNGDCFALFHPLPSSLPPSLAPGGWQGMPPSIIPPLPKRPALEKANGATAMFNAGMFQYQQALANMQFQQHAAFIPSGRAPIAPTIPPQVGPLWHLRYPSGRAPMAPLFTPQVGPLWHLRYPSVPMMHGATPATVSAATTSATSVPFATATANQVCSFTASSVHSEPLGQWVRLYQGRWGGVRSPTANGTLKFVSDGLTVQVSHSQWDSKLKS
ncbi:hypothetical protein JZ751_022391 [Albula glossodonta]|uniref:Uncharacterized protein n=1 Tax=Albula glossodonta TaxID=121402 RepID=A0A8T2MRI8_9TELE|nr:hypothetical protein JZ751_022391 [Albula glossodonta]